jgi:GAF domain-containing protein
MQPQYVEFIPTTRSELCVPLKSGNGVLGVLNVESPRPGAFSEQDQKLLQMLADQAAVAIENADLVQQTELGFEAIVQLLQLSLDTTLEAGPSVSISSYEKLLQRISRRATELLGAYGAAVLICHHRNELLEVKASYNLGEIAGTTVGSGEGTSSGVVDAGMPLIVNDHRSLHDTSRIFDRTDVGDLLGATVQVPLLSRGRVVGVLAVYDTVGGKGFHQRHISRLKGFAAIAAMATENARTFVRLAKRMQAVQQELYEFLMSTHSALIGSDGLGPFLHHIAVTLSHEPWDGCGLWLLDAEKEALLLGWATETRLPSDTATAVDLDDSLLGDVISEGEPIAAPDLESQPSSKARDWAAGLGAKSLVAVPLVGQAQVLGALVAYSHSQADFSWNHVVRILATASQTAIALRFAEVRQDHAACLGLLDLVLRHHDEPAFPFREMARIVMSVVGAQACLVHTLEGGCRLVPKTSLGLSLDALPGGIDIGEPFVTTRVVKKRVPVRLLDLREAPDALPGQVREATARPVQGESRNSYLGVPIMHRGTALGVIELLGKRGETELLNWFTEHDEILLCAIARRLAPAIGKAARRQSEGDGASRGLEERIQ